MCQNVRILKFGHFVQILLLPCILSNVVCSGTYNQPSAFAGRVPGGAQQAGQCGGGRDAPGLCQAAGQNGEQLHAVLDHGKVLVKQDLLECPRNYF